MRQLDSGTLQATDFERFELQGGSPELEEMILGPHDDMFFWRATVTEDHQGRALGLAGNDVLIGPDVSPGTFRLFGGAGDDLLFSGGGPRRGPLTDTRLIGGEGDDYLFVGSGAASPYYNNLLVGGPGADTFVFQANSDSHIRVADFQRGEDRLVIFNSFQAAMSRKSQDTPHPTSETGPEIQNYLSNFDLADIGQYFTAHLRQLSDADIVSSTQDVLEFAVSKNFLDWGFRYHQQSGTMEVSVHHDPWETLQIHVNADGPLDISDF